MIQTHCCFNPEASLKAIFRDSQWMYKIGFGGMINASALLLGLMTPVLMPIVLALLALSYGYRLRVIRYQFLDKESMLPDWNNFLELFMSGLNWLAIQFALFMILVALATTCFLFGVLAGFAKVSNPAFLTWSSGSILVLQGIWLALDFLTPFLMVNFALQEKVMAGFAVLKVVHRAKGKWANFLFAWLLGIGIKWASIIVPMLTVFGVFLIPSTFFIAQVLAAAWTAQAWDGQK